MSNKPRRPEENAKDPNLGQKDVARKKTELDENEEEGDDELEPKDQSRSRKASADL